MNNRARLERLLGGTELAALRQRLRRRYERGEELSVITLTGLSEPERIALAGLLGRRIQHGASMRVDVRQIDLVLCRSGVASSLHEALALLDGPIVNHRHEQALLQEQWANVVLACSEKRLKNMLSDGSGLSLLKRLAKGDPSIGARLCTDVQRVLKHLPAMGLPRSRLAAMVLGDAHALDQGRPVATLILALLRQVRSDSTNDAMQIDMQADDRARDIWAGAGVLVNELARPVLHLNLPHNGGLPTSGEPCYLSLRKLLRSQVQWDVQDRVVFVCENPNLLAIAADELGARSAPLICTDGMPAAAQRTLLQQVSAAGAILYYHGDFDWPGIRIGNLMMREFHARPWRYRTQDYLDAATDNEKGRALGAEKVDADWDASLESAMTDRGYAIDEEAVAESLLGDLRV
jgi:uncharacterized protein (TIGR02679 family)